MIPREANERIEVLKWEAFADDLMSAAINLYMEKSGIPVIFIKILPRRMENNIHVCLRVY